jgi:DNA-binding NarL/FixJ family response regulator
VSLGAASLRRAIEVLARRARVPLSDDPAWAAAAASAADGDAAAATGDAADTQPVATRPGRAAGRRDAAPTHTLSAREIEVLRLVAAGRSNGEIGDELFITRKTAGVHVTHILDKLGVSNRVEAAMAAARLGLLEPDAETEPEPRVG